MGREGGSEWVVEEERRWKGERLEQGKGRRGRRRGEINKREEGRGESKGKGREAVV